MFNSPARLTRIALCFLLIALTISSSLSGLLPPPTVQAADKADLTITSTVSPSPTTADKYTAVFSYTNSTQNKINISGKNNTLAGGVEGQQPPTQFEVGKTERAIVVDLKCEEGITWRIQYLGTEIITEAQAPKCGSTNNKDPASNVSSCANPKGWTENTAERKDEYVKLYWYPKTNTVPTNATPQSNPELFGSRACSFAERKHFTENGAILDIKNEFIAEKNGKYEYTNKGNSYRVYFSADPSKGFKFKTSNGEETTVESIKLSKVDITKASASIIGDTITYADVLPFVDLKFKLNTEGLSKEFVIKDPKGLTNDLSEITFVYSGTTLTKNNTLKEELKLLPTYNQKLEDKSLIDAETLLSEVDQNREYVTKFSSDSNTRAKAGLQEEYVSAQKDKVQKLKTKQNLTEVQTKNELKKIDELANANDQISTPGLIKFGVPFWYDASQSLSTRITFAVSEDGKSLTLYPDIEALKDSNVTYPLVIDPTAYQYRDGAKDTWVSENGLPSSRNLNNTFQLTVGGNSFNGAVGADPDPNISRVFMSFNNPYVGIPIKTAYLRLWQYSHDGGAFTANIGWVCDPNFDENITWSNQVGICSGTVGTISVPTAWDSEIWSTNIKDVIGVSNTRFGLFIRDPIETTSIARNGNFCSRESWATDWSTKCGAASRTPFIDLVYNDPPAAPSANGVRSNSGNDPMSNNDIVTGCDMSVTNDARCGRTRNVQYNVSNVYDPDEGCSNPNVKVQVNQQTNFRTWSGGSAWYEHVAPAVAGINGNAQDNQSDNDPCKRKFDSPNQNGEITWTARNIDLQGTASLNWSNAKRFYLDSSAPVKITNTNLPAVSTSQPTVILPVITDNSTDKLTINHDPIIETISRIEYAADTSKIIAATATVFGSPIKLATDPSVSQLRQFTVQFVNGKQVMRSMADQSKCLTLSLNGNVTLEGCQGVSTQNLISDEQGRIASLDAGGNRVMCLELKGAETTNGTDLQSKPCSNSRAQKFNVVRFLSPSNGGNGDTSRPLYTPWQLHYGSNVRDTASNWGPNRLILANPLDIPSEQYSFESNGAIRGIDGACLDSWGPPQAGTPLGYGPCHDGWNQRWEVTDKSQIKQRGYNLCLDAGNTYAAWGRTLTVQSCNDNFNQKFNIKKLPTGQWPADIATPANITNLQPNAIFHIKNSWNPSLSIDGGWYDSGALYGRYIRWNGTGYTYETNPTSPLQQFIYTSNKEIKPYKNVKQSLDNVCLGTASAPVGLTQINWLPCNGTDFQKWNPDSLGRLITQSNGGMCLDIQGGNIFNNAGQLVTWSCYDGMSQKWSFDFDVASPGPRTFEYPNMGMSTEVRYQKNNNGVWCNLSTINTSTVSLPNNSSCTNTPNATFNPSDQIKVQYRARDRTNTSYNLSQWYELGTTTIATNDITYINNSLLVRPFDSASSPTDLNALNTSDKRFSPSNPTSVNLKDALSIKYQFTTKYLRLAALAVKDKNGNTIAQLTRCKLNNTIEAPCNDLNPAYNPNGTNTAEYSWSGKNSTGDSYPDGRYELQPVILGITCQSDNLIKLTGGQATNSWAYGDSQNCYYNNELTGDDRYVVLDNTGANIAISTPANNAWVNTPNYVIKGGVAGYNNTVLEDRDALRLEICQVLASVCTYSSTPFDSIKNWSFTPALIRGSNEFRFKSTDLAYNTITQIGNPNDTVANNAADTKVYNDELQTNWKINYEADAPQITSVAPAAISDPTFRAPRIEIKIKDTNPGANPLFVSGINTGVNPIGYDISLLRKFSASESTWKEIPLYKDGINLTDNTTQDNQRILKSFACSATPTTVDESTCTLELTNLQVDGLYKLFVRTRDIAGNQTCTATYTEARDIQCVAGNSIQTTDYGFEVKTNTYQVISSPTTTSLNTANTQYTISGTSEKSRSLTQKSLVRITNSALDNGVGRYIEFEVDPSKNSVLPAEYNLATNALIGAENIDNASRLMTNIARSLTLSCPGTTVDHDTNPLTPQIEVCNWSYRISLRPNATAGTPLTNPITVTTTDWRSNIVRYDNITQVDTSKFDLGVSSSSPVFSPDGDNNFDTVTLNSFATNPDNSALTGITSSKIDIRNSANVLVYSITNPGGLITNTLWNGISNQSGITATDGNHTVTLTVNRTVASIATTTTSQPITVLRKTTFAPGEVQLFTPNSGYVTNRGSITIQGQAAPSTNSITYYIDICIKAMNIGENDTDSYTVASCPAGSLVSTQTNNTNGFFSVIGSMNVTTRQKYKLIAFIRSYADVNSRSTPRIVITDTGTLLQNASIQVDLTGINSQTELNSYTNISQLKMMTIRATVARDTEALDINWGYYDNNKVIPNNYGGLFLDNNRVATINNTSEPVGKYNPTNPGLPGLRADLAGLYKKDNTAANNRRINNYADLNNMSKTDADLYFMDPSNATALPKDLTANITTLRNNKCNQTTCDWVFLYPFPNWISGGQFDLRLRAYRGDVSNDIMLPVVINGQILTAPKLLEVNRAQGTQWTSTSSVNNNDPELTKSFYTNNANSRIFIGAEASTKYTFVIKAFDNLGVQVGTTYTLQTATDTLARPTETNGVISFDLNLIALPGININDKRYIIYHVDANNTQKPIGTLILDRTAPQLDWMTTTANKPYALGCQVAWKSCDPNLANTQGNPKSVSPWVSAGNAVQYYYRASEPVISTQVINENTIATVGSKVFASPDLACAQKYNQENYRVANSGTATDPCLDKFKLSRESLVVMTITNPDDRFEGILDNYVYLKDLAGNTSIIGNSKTKLDQYIALPSTSDEVKSASRFDAQYDAGFLIDSDGLGNINRTNNTVIKATSSVTGANAGAINALAAGTTLNTDQLKMVVADAGTGREALPVGYPYSIAVTSTELPNGDVVTTGGRGKSLDFRIFADITRPTRTESLILNNWGVSQKVADTICTDASGVILASNSPLVVILDPIGNPGAARYVATNLACSILSDSFSQNISTLINRTVIADGINADSLYPEKDRLDQGGNKYVTRGNTITFSALSERNQRLVLNIMRTDRRTNTLTTSNAFPVVSQSGCVANTLIPASYFQIGGVVGSGVNTVGDKLRNGSVSMFKDVCRSEISYVFSDDGSQDATGQANNVYEFAVYPVDQAGNVPSDKGGALVAGTGAQAGNPDVGGNGTGVSGQSTGMKSGSVLIGRDTISGTAPSITLSPSVSTSGFSGDESSTDPLTRRITNDVSINVVQSGETSSDYQSSLKMERNVVSGTGGSAVSTLASPFEVNNSGKTVVRNNSNIPYSQNNYRTIKGGDTTDSAGTTISNGTILEQAKTSYVLGSSVVGGNGNAVSISDPVRSTRDDSRPVGDNCVVTSNSPIVNRRIGVCNDGLYTVNSRQVDTSGNRSGWDGRRVERDTTSPSAPTINLTKNLINYGLYEQLAVSITAEANTQAFITVSGTENINRQFSVSNSGGLNITNLLGKNLACGGLTYTVSITIRDRAGNMSTATIGSVISGSCPSCSGSGTSGGYINPINSPQAVKTSGWRTTERPNHDGLDIAVGGDPYDQTVVSAKAGTVIEIVNQYQNNWGKADAVINPVYGGYGNYVVIDHGSNVKSKYTHLGQISVTLNQAVTQGQAIGLMGATGNSTAPHLHFMITINSVDQDPAQFVMIGSGATTDTNQRSVFCNTNARDGEDLITNTSPDSEPSEQGPYSVKNTVLNSNFTLVDNDTTSFRSINTIIQLQFNIDISNTWMSQSNVASLICKNIVIPQGVYGADYLRNVGDCGGDFNIIGQAEKTAYYLWGMVQGCAKNITNLLTSIPEIPNSLSAMFSYVWKLLSNSDTRSNLSNMINSLNNNPEAWDIIGLAGLVSDGDYVQGLITALQSSTDNNVKAYLEQKAIEYLNKYTNQTDMKLRLEMIGKAHGYTYLDVGALFVGVGEVKAALKSSTAVANTLKAIEGLGVAAKLESALNLLKNSSKILINRLNRYVDQTIMYLDELVTIRRFSSEFIGVSGSDAWKYISSNDTNKFNNFIFSIADDGTKLLSKEARRVDKSIIISIDPNTIRFSQSSVGGTRYNSVLDSMNINGYNIDIIPPIDVVRMSDNVLTSLDNRRLLAAKNLGNQAKVIEHLSTELLPDYYKNTRYKDFAIKPNTWGEAINLRIQGQSNGWKTLNTNGSFNPPNITSN